MLANTLLDLVSEGVQCCSEQARRSCWRLGGDDRRFPWATLLMALSLKSCEVETVTTVVWLVSLAAGRKREGRDGKLKSHCREQLIRAARCQGRWMGRHAAEVSVENAGHVDVHRRWWRSPRWQAEVLLLCRVLFMATWRCSKPKRLPRLGPVLKIGCRQTGRDGPRYRDLLLSLMAPHAPHGWAGVRVAQNTEWSPLYWRQRLREVEPSKKMEASAWR